MDAGTGQEGEQEDKQDGRPKTVVSKEIRGTIIDHVINHGLSLKEAGLRVQPNLPRSAAASTVFKDFQAKQQVYKYR